MNVDVVVETEIERPTEEVAAFAGDPMNAPKWYVNIKSAQWREQGATIDFVAHFMGKKLEYTYEIVENVPGKKLVMRTAQGPFPMETTYTWEETQPGKTRMTLRNRGTPSGFSKLFAPLMAGAMKKATQKDLARLKSILER
jgi:uncharacterized membrane protein